MKFKRLVFLVAVAALAAVVPAQAQDKKGVDYAFLVACSGYDKTQLRELPYTVNDIEDFKKALLTTGFAEANVKVLHDKQTERRYHSERSKIMKELKLLLAGVKPEDTLAVAFSGHGVHFKGDKTGYFCPLDADLEDKTSLIPMDGPGGVFELLKSCKAKRKLLIVNACRNDPTSDLAQAGSKVNLDDEDAEQVPEGIAALYSCQKGQKSYFDPKRQRGIFFDHVIRAWQGEYLTGEEKLTLESVFDQVVAKTKGDADKTFGVAQIPVVRREYQGKWIVNGLGKPLVFPGEDKFQAGLKHGYGLDGKVNLAEATRCYRDAVALKHPLAKVELARFYRNAFFLPPDQKEAEQLCREALPEVRKAAERNNANAQSNLGWIFSCGLGVERDEIEAAQWYRKAADQNNPVAQIRLAEMLYNGFGGLQVGKDEKEAMKWCRKAADQYFPESQYLLSTFYRFGKGVEKDEKEALKWLRKAAEQNLPWAQVSLGELYAGGRMGVVYDDKEAVKWYRKATEQNDTLAFTMLGSMYEVGRGVEKDTKEAAKWYRKALAQGSPIAEGDLKRIGYDP